MSDTVIMKYGRPPPEDFQKLVLEMLELMSGVYLPRFDGSRLVAKTVPLTHTRTWDVVQALLTGLEAGYKAKLGPTKPYGLKYMKIVFPKMDREPYLGDEIVEWYCTRDEAHQRRMVLNESIRLRLETLHMSRPVLHDKIAKLSEQFRPKIIHSSEREYHF